MPRVLTALIVAGVLVVAATPAQGITTLGTEDNGRHPEVGAMVYTSQADGYRHALCSGALVAPRVFLTASHCLQALIDRDLEARVSFDEVISDSSTVYEGDPQLNPLYNPKQGSAHDVSAIVLDQSPGITPASLPNEGLLTRLKRAGELTSFTLPGYGSNEQLVVPGTGPTFPRTDRRMVAVVGFDALTKTVIHESQRIAQGQSGACFGDSGGPSFLGSGVGETDVVVGVTTAGDSACYATNTASRTDTEEALDFLHGLPGF